MSASPVEVASTYPAWCDEQPINTSPASHRIATRISRAHACHRYNVGQQTRTRRRADCVAGVDRTVDDAVAEKSLELIVGHCKDPKSHPGTAACDPAVTQSIRLATLQLCVRWIVAPCARTWTKPWSSSQSLAEIPAATSSAHSTTRSMSAHGARCDGTTAGSREVTCPARRDVTSPMAARGWNDPAKPG